MKEGRGNKRVGGGERRETENQGRGEKEEGKREG